MATLVKLPADLALEFARIQGETFDAYMDRSYAVMDRLQEVSKALPEGEVKGGIIRFQVADGYACYRVESAKPLKVSHLPYGDEYAVNAMTLRGMRLDDVQGMLARERALHKMFAARKAPKP